MKKYIFLLTVALFLLPTGLKSSMQPTAAKTAGPLLKHFAKKTFSGAMTGLHWTIAAGTSIHTGLTRGKALYDEKKYFVNLPNANEEITQFITAALKSTHNKKIDAVKINPKGDIIQTPLATLNKHIILSPSANREITEALYNNNEQILNKWRSSLEHEGNHIKNNDFIWRTAADLTLPFVTHGSVKVIRNALPIAKKTRSFLGEQFIKIPTALGKNLITSMTTAGVYRIQEQRADDDISNNINVLVGIKTFLEEEDEKQNNPLLKMGWSPKQITMLDWTGNFFDHHPLPTKRIEKFNQRIASLQKQSQHNDNSNNS